MDLSNTNRNVSELVEMTRNSVHMLYETVIPSQLAELEII